MRVITLNVNGIRASLKKGLFRWLSEQNADVICLQEIRAPEALLGQATYQLPGYHCYYEPAQKAGYSGVGIFSRHLPQRIVRGLGFSLADEEGRYIHLEWEKLVVASLYLPSGTSGETRQALKYTFLDKYEPILEKVLKTQRPMIIAGDWNIAHKKIDLKNWQSNQTHSGFLPEERAWMDKIFDNMGFVDAFRVINQAPDQYTWWSHRGRAWEKNVGWRIDYQVITPDLKATVQGAQIYKEERFSDHAPLTVDYAFLAF